MNRYVTSDRHIGHKNILKYDKRPFKNLDKHDQAIIDTINKTVKKDDELFFLGDAFLCGITRARKYLSQLHCNNISYTVGNHDGRQQQALFDELGRTNLGLLYEDQSLRIVLSHYPLQEWRNKHYGWKHYHGHSHHKLKPIKGRQDCTLNFRHLKKPLLINDKDAGTILQPYKPLPVPRQSKNQKATRGLLNLQGILDKLQAKRV